MKLRDSRSRALRGARIVAAAIALAATLVVAGPAPSVAQDATGSVTLLGQTPVRVPGEPFTATLRIRTSTATSSLELAVGTYRRMGSRSEFENALEGRLPTRTPRDLVRLPLDSLTRDADGNVAVTIDPRFTQEGVYPVRIELRDVDGGNVIDGFTTFLISVPATIESDPLDVALVLPAHAPPAVQPDGSIELPAARAAALGDVATALATQSTVPLTLVPTPETLEALAASTSAADRDTATTLARSSAERQAVAGTYVPTNLTTLLQAGLTGEVNAQLERGERVLTEVLGASVTRNLRVADERLDGDALTALENQGVERLVVPERFLDPIRPPNGITLTARFDIPTARAAFESAAADQGLAAHFERDVAPALGASHLLADLAVLWLDRPGRAQERRGVVVLPSRTWAPNANFVSTLLAGLAAIPVLAPVTLDTFFTTVGPVRTRGEVLERSFASGGASSAIGASAIRAARRELEGFASIVDPANPALDTLDRRLLVSLSSDLRAGERAAYIGGVRDAIDSELGSIAMPERRSITLTAREGELPVTITSSLPYPITVLLTLDSDTLDFPAGASRRVELTHQNTTERFEVHARGSGSFPVRVRVTAPQGNLVIAESRFTVRSTAVSGVGVALSVGAAGFLVVWWASHLRTRRAARRPARA